MLREGIVSIIRYDGDRFDVMFCRNNWSGVLSPCKLTGREALVDFLEHQLGVRNEVVKDALLQIDREGTARIPRVQLSDELRFRLGLVSSDEGLSQSQTAG